MQRLNILDLAELVVVAPGKKPNDGPVVCHAGILIPDGRGEKFEETFRGLGAGVGDHRRDDDSRGGCADCLRPYAGQEVDNAIGKPVATCAVNYCAMRGSISPLLYPQLLATKEITSRHTVGLTKYHYKLYFKNRIFVEFVIPRTITC
jgi:hypothetical protein